MGGLRASIQGIKLVDECRKKKSWNRQANSWCTAANVSLPTLKRFWRKIPIQEEAFIKICKAVGLENWEKIVDRNPVSCQERISSFLDYENSWVGREKLAAQLSAKLRGVCRILILTGITGIGKTALGEQLVWGLQGDFPQSVRVNFDGNENADFVSIAAQLMAGWEETVTPEIRQEPQNLLNWLVSKLRKNRYLLLIDSLENILEGDAETGWSNFKDEWWEKFFQSLLSANSCESCIVLTSQDLPGQLAAVGSRYPKLWHCQPLSGLTEPERLALFEKTGLEVGAQSPEKDYLERIGAAYEGHPLALRAIAGEIISHPFNGNVVAYWKKYGYEVQEVERCQQEAEIESSGDRLRLDRYNPNLKKAVEQRVEKTFERLAKDVFNAYLLLCHGSVYRRPVPEKAWLRHLQYFGCNEEQQEIALDTLHDRYLIEEEIDNNNNLLLRQHNLIRSMAQKHLKKLTTREQPL